MTSRESPEKIYASPSDEWYSESPPRTSISPTTKRQLEADLDELSSLSHSSDPEHEVWDSTRKTPQEVAAWYVEYKGCNRNLKEMARRGCEGTTGIHIVCAQTLACTDALLVTIQATAARVSTPQTLARKRSKGYAPRLVVGGVDTTSSDEEQATALNDTGVPSASTITVGSLNVTLSTLTKALPARPTVKMSIHD